MLLGLGSLFLIMDVPFAEFRGPSSDLVHAFADHPVQLLAKPADLLDVVAFDQATH